MFATFRHSLARVRERGRERRERILLSLTVKQHWTRFPLTRFKSFTDGNCPWNTSCVVFPFLMMAENGEAVSRCHRRVFPFNISHRSKVAWPTNRPMYAWVNWKCVILLEGLSDKGFKKLYFFFYIFQSSRLICPYRYTCDYFYVQRSLRYWPWKWKTSTVGKFSIRIRSERCFQKSGMIFSLPWISLGKNTQRQSYWFESVWKCFPFFPSLDTYVRWRAVLLENICV